MVPKDSLIGCVIRSWADEEMVNVTFQRLSVAWCNTGRARPCGGSLFKDGPESLIESAMKSVIFLMNRAFNSTPNGMDAWVGTCASLIASFSLLNGTESNYNLSSDFQLLLSEQDPRETFPSVIQTLQG